MNAAIHYENANFLRELAESLPSIRPQGSQAQAELLQRLADEELAQAEHDEWVRAKVGAARADDRPGINTEQLRKLLNIRYEELRNGS